MQFTAEIDESYYKASYQQTAVQPILSVACETAHNIKYQSKCGGILQSGDPIELCLTPLLRILQQKTLAENKGKNAKRHIDKKQPILVRAIFSPMTHAAPIPCKAREATNIINDCDVGQRRIAGSRNKIRRSRFHSSLACYNLPDELQLWQYSFLWKIFVLTCYYKACATKIVSESFHLFLNVRFRQSFVNNSIPIKLNTLKYLY